MCNNCFNLLVSMKKYVGLCPVNCLCQSMAKTFKFDVCPVKCLCQSVAKTFKFDVSIFLEAVQLLKAVISYKSFT